MLQPLKSARKWINGELSDATTDSLERIEHQTERCVELLSKQKKCKGEHDGKISRR